MCDSGGIPAKTILDLCRPPEEPPTRHVDQTTLIPGTALIFGRSGAAVYRALVGQLRSRGLRRPDRGEPREILHVDLECDCEIIATLRILASNLRGRRF
jgi:hypothetical protein